MCGGDIRWRTVLHWGRRRRGRAVARSLEIRFRFNAKNRPSDIQNNGYSRLGISATRKDIHRRAPGGTGSVYAGGSREGGIERFEDEPGRYGVLGKEERRADPEGHGIPQRCSGGSGHEQGQSGGAGGIE